MTDSVAIADKILRGIGDMILSIGYVEGRLDTLSTFADGRFSQELLEIKSALADIASDLIEMTGGDA